MIKFALLTHPRSGSTLVSLALRTHPEIRMFGELFNDELDERVRAFEAGYRSRPSAYRYLNCLRGGAYNSGQEGADFIERSVYFDPSQDRPCATGFKLFYNQARADPGAATVWDYIRSHEEIRIVHLIRSNLLETFLSLRTALQTNVWAVAACGSNPQILPSFELCAKECESYFRRILAQRNHLVSVLSSSGRRWLTIEYERDLLFNFEDTLERIHSFLDVQILKSTPALRKQANDAIVERIRNYAHLRQHFESTPFRSYFIHDQ